MTVGFWDKWSEKGLTIIYGMAVLAAWFRLKYPHVAIGALASSAPILNFENITSPYSFNNIITQDFRVGTPLFIYQ